MTKGRLCFIYSIFLFFIFNSLTWANDFTLSNKYLVVTVNSNNKFVSISKINSNQPFAISENLAFFQRINKIAINDSVFGAGQAFVLMDGKNEQARIMLYQDLPFVLFQFTIRSEQHKNEIINRIETAKFNLSFINSLNLIKTFGTGGLLAPEKNSGSYAWQSIIDPESKNGVVSGWLTHDRASGVFFTNVDKNDISLIARSDYGYLKLAPHQATKSEILMLGWFDDARIGLENWAEAVAKQYRIKLPALPSGYCTWYSDKHGGSSDEKNLIDLAEVAAKKLISHDFQFVQIDDGWQAGDSKGNGPNKNFTAHRTGGPFSSGMRKTAETLKSFGLMPGIWFMPFAGTYNDPWFEFHQDWFVKNENGEIYDTDWGGSSLDLTHPEVKNYLRSMVTRFSNEWGYRYFKMDGLYTGLAAQQNYINSGYKEDHFGDARFYNPEKTNVEAYRDGLKLIRSAVGKDVFLLGCTVTQNMRSYAASFGLLDAMRIGPDNNSSWKEWLGASPVYGSRHYFLNGRIWYNDPDASYVRSTLSLNEARTVASWTAITGQLITNSDWIPDLPAERIEILKRTMPAHHAIARPVDLFENNLPRVWTVHSSNRDLVGFFNWDDKNLNENILLNKLRLNHDKTYVGFDYWQNEFISPFQEKLQVNLKSHESKIIAIRELLKRPFVLSTNRHVTQGIIDILSESWDEKTKTLQGESQVIGGDIYELRVVVPDKWKLTQPIVTNDSVIITASPKEGMLQRIQIESPISQKVNWSLKFRDSIS